MASSSSLYVDLQSPKNAITVLPSGNVGIGTTNPQAKLHVNGIVKLNSIAFHAIRTNVNVTLSTSVNLSQYYNSTTFNTGNCFDTTTGYFTPTINGYYFLTCSVYIPATQSTTTMRKNATSATNGDSVAVTFAGSGTGAYYHANLSGAVLLNGVDDNVSIWLNAGSLTIDGTTNRANNFTGFLMYALP